MPEINAPALETMARIFDQWRAWDKSNHRTHGSVVTEDTLIICPPEWPSHGQLKRWSGFLRDVVEEQTQKE